MVVPMFLAMGLVFVEVFITRNFKSIGEKLFHCLNYLPFFQWIEKYQFYKDILQAAQEKEKVDEFAYRMNFWIDTFEEFLIDDEWSWPEIEPKFEKSEVTTDLGTLCFLLEVLLL